MISPWRGCLASHLVMKDGEVIEAGLTIACSTTRRKPIRSSSYPRACRMTETAPLIEVEGSRRASPAFARQFVLRVVDGVSSPCGPANASRSAGRPHRQSFDPQGRVPAITQVDAGRILIRDGQAKGRSRERLPRAVISLRRRVIGYVSQFLRVIPRVSARDVVAAARGKPALRRMARARGGAPAARSTSPSRLWVAPARDLSGGDSSASILRSAGSRAAAATTSRAETRGITRRNWLTSR